MRMAININHPPGGFSNHSLLTVKCENVINITYYKGPHFLSSSILSLTGIVSLPMELGSIFLLSIWTWVLIYVKGKNDAITLLRA